MVAMLMLSECEAMGRRRLFRPPEFRESRAEWRETAREEPQPPSLLLNTYAVKAVDDDRVAETPKGWYGIHRLLKNNKNALNQLNRVTGGSKCLLSNWHHDLSMETIVHRICLIISYRTISLSP